MQVLEKVTRDVISAHLKECLAPLEGILARMRAAESAQGPRRCRDCGKELKTNMAAKMHKMKCRRAKAVAVRTEEEQSLAKKM